MATQSPTKPSSINISNKTQNSLYLERVEEALSRSLLKMEPYEDDAYIEKNIVCGSEGTMVKHGPRLPFYPHVELGTAPITVKCIEDLQKIRPFGVNTNKNIVTHHDPNTGNATLGGCINRNFADSAQKKCDDIGRKPDCLAIDLSAPTDATDPAKITSSATIRKRESCLIESTRNSIRVSFYSYSICLLSKVKLPTPVFLLSSGTFSLYERSLFTSLCLTDLLASNEICAKPTCAARKNASFPGVTPDDSVLVSQTPSSLQLPANQLAQLQSVTLKRCRLPFDF
jgi:hypothetical protein